MIFKRNLLKLLFGVVVVSAFSVSHFNVPTQVSAATSSCSYLLKASDGSLSSSQLEQKVACLQQQQSQNQKQLSQTQQQAQTLQSQIDNINSNISLTNNQISNTTDQINATNSIISDLTNSIAQTQSQLDTLNSQLKTAYQQLYEMSQTSLTDMVFQGDSLNALLSQSQYIESLQTSLQANITKSNQLKSDLESQKADSLNQQASLQSLNDQLQQNKTSLNNQVGQKNYILQATQGQEANYQALANKLSTQIESVSSDAIQARLREASDGGETITGGTGGYPWANKVQDSGGDPWGFYYRECTSFGAWKFNQVFGKDFYGYGAGNAWNWPSLASYEGYNTSSTPRADSIVSWPVNTAEYMYYGHIAWVDSVNSNGTINIEEYNWTTAGGYDMRTNVTPSHYGNATYIFP